MAYCPRCGRDQRCGCAKCHVCDVELVERPASPTTGAAPPGLMAAGGLMREGRGPAEPARAGAAFRERTKTPAGTSTTGALPGVLLILGCGILLITLVEAVNNALGFPGVGAASTADGLKRLGYCLGSILYTGSVRVLIGFALVAAGLLWEPDWPFAEAELSRRMVRTLGFTMGVISSLCLVATLLLVLPMGTSSFLLKNLVPTLWATVCIMLLMGSALLGGGYILVTRASGRGHRLEYGGGEGTGDGAVKSYGSEGAGRESH